MKHNKYGTGTPLAGIEIPQLARDFGTPFYLYDLMAIQEKIAVLRQVFAPSIRLYYAVKANSNLELLKAMRGLVDGLDISSAGELEQSLLAGYTASSMSFAGPGKTRADITLALERGIGILSAESLRELRDIRHRASALGQRAAITLRINPELLIKEFAVKMGGRSTPFGIDEEDIEKAISYIDRNKETLNLLGIHVYAGTQCLDAKALVRNVENTLGLARRVQKAHGRPCAVVNLGGGLGVSYHDEALQLDTALLAGGVNRAVQRFTDDTGSGAHFIFELGRYLVADAGLYVARVISEKQSRGQMYYVLDGGMHHHLAASGNLGATLRKNFIIRNISRPDAPLCRCSLVGPLCTPLDLMGKNVSIPAPRIGDLIAFLRSGSYAYTASPLLFLGHRTPAELLFDGKNVRVIRASKNLTDFNSA